MVYRLERKKYQPVLDRAKKRMLEGIRLSQRGNLLLVHPDVSGAELECILGWQNEQVTHLILQPNDKLSLILDGDKEEIHSWVNSKLTTLFEDVPVPDWEL